MKSCDKKTYYSVNQIQKNPNDCENITQERLMTEIEYLLVGILTQQLSQLYKKIITQTLPCKIQVLPRNFFRTELVLMIKRQ